MRIGRASLLASICFGCTLGQQGNAPRLGAQAPALGYKEVPDWPIPATNAAGTAAAWNFIQVSGVAIEASGHILVLHRGAHPLLEFESNGKFMRSWNNVLFSEGKVAAVAGGDRVPGRSFYSAVYGPAGCDSCGAHSVRVDPEHNVWVVDATGQVVYKMDPQGKVIMQLGQKGVSGMGRNNFNLPTDVAFAPNGDFYVTDGYGNSRVMKFSKDGKLLLQWGKKGAAEGEFNLPHSIVLDRDGMVYVGDRENNRVQIFSPDGRFLRQWTQLGSPWGLAITTAQEIYMADGKNNRVLKLTREGKVLGVLGSPGKGPGQFAFAHHLAVSNQGELYVAEILNWRVQKFVPR